MKFENACFISYPHPREKGGRLASLVREVYEAIKEELDGFVSEIVYFDEERLKLHDQYDKVLHDAICRSYCMIVIYCPEYGRRDYCRREFKLMQDISDKRRKLLGEVGEATHFIIPISLVKRDKAPAELGQDARNVLDLSAYLAQRPKRNLLKSNDDLYKGIMEIKQTIQELRELLRQHPEVNGEHVSCCGLPLPAKGILPEWAEQAPSFPR
ncbi:MAG: toll/interleukin-1 receptor domain-containing protein [Betaproteobacteria bacterium]|nr:toll/interleukin-1 receptor domain-containing protein [Betaproteobacteria bacterium]